MSETTGDIIGRGWRAGRAIGQDISEFRYNRGESKLREKYTEEAQAAGVDLSEYMAAPEIISRYENDLSALYQKSGAKKRGVVGADGSALNEGSRSAIHADVARGGERRASTKALAGDWEGAHAERGKVGGALGNFDAASSSRVAVEQIQTGKAAIKDGKVDNTRLAGGQALAAANRGDVDGAAKASGAQQQFRMQTATQLAGTLSQMLDNPTQFGDQIVGTFENLKEYLPELAEFNLQVDPASGTTVIYQDGQPIGALDDPEEIRDMLTQFTSDPSGVLEARKQSQIAAATDQRDRGRKIEDEVRGAQMKVIEKFGDAGVDGIKTQNLLQAQEKASNAGWRTLGSSDDGTITAALGERVVKILPAAPAGPDGRPGYASRMIDAATGQTINPAELGAAGSAIAEYGIAMDVMRQDAAFQRNVGVLRMQLELLDSMMGGESAQSSGLPGAPKIGGALGGDSAPGGALPADAQAVQQTLSDLGDSFGFETTSVTRSEDENRRVGGVDNSQHLESRGTARDFRVAGKSPEEIRRFVAALEAEGFEVITKNHGTGPHIHAELPPGGRRGSASALPPKLDPVAGGYGKQAPVAAAAPRGGALPAPLNYKGGGEIGGATSNGAPLPSMPGGGSYDPLKGVSLINDIARQTR
jgi:hypothetical protein